MDPRLAMVDLSRFLHCGINADMLRSYKPMNELDDQYRQQVVYAGEVIEFSKGDKVFEGKVDRSRYYFLLKGALTFRSGIFQRKNIDCLDPVSAFDICPLIPDGVDVFAIKPGFMLSVDSDMLDTALAWMKSNVLGVGRDIHLESEIEFCTKQLNELVAIESHDHNDWMSLLLDSPLFFNLPPANISRVFNLFERIFVKQGDVIIRQGEEGQYFYVIIAGSAKVIVDNRDKPVAELASGDYFGEGAIVTGAPRSASVVMTSDGLLGRLDHDSFEHLLHDPVVKFISPDELGNEIRKDIRHSVLLDVRSRDEYLYRPTPNSRNIPCEDLRDSLNGFDSACTYYISEEGGKRSELAAHLLSQANLKAFVIRST